MNTCETCAAFAALSKECRAHSPQPMLVTIASGHTVTLGIFPSTKPESWCGEWRAPETKE